VTDPDPADVETAESPVAKPSRQCRHLLPVRGGTLGCTAPAGHPTRIHYDEDFPLPDGRVAAWECKDDSRPDVRRLPRHHDRRHHRPLRGQAPHGQRPRR
jgi:hypothetical protein